MIHPSLKEFADRMSSIIPVIFRELARRQTNELAQGKISLPQFLILDFLNSLGELKMSDIAKHMRVTTAAMTGMVDRLVCCGYAERLSVPNDRRVIKIKATVKGIELVKRIYQQRRQMIIDIFGQLSQQDRENYLKILTQIYGVISKGK